MEKSFVLETLESDEDKFGAPEDNEWSKLIKARFKEGYVEGKYMGGESTVQSGFDHGYEKGFEMSYPISVLKGLLAANELLQKDSNSDSLQRSKEIKQMLNEFEKKSMQFMKKSDDSSNVALDSVNENGDTLTEETLNENSVRTENVNSCDVNEINRELHELKKKVLIFLKDCNQPHIFQQIQHCFEKWDLSFTRNSSHNVDLSTSDASIHQAQCLQDKS